MTNATLLGQIILFVVLALPLLLTVIVLILIIFGLIAGYKLIKWLWSKR